MRIDTTKVELTADDMATALKLPDNFAIRRDYEHAKVIGTTWALGPVIETRESDLIERSNAIALRRALEARSEFADQWAISRATHEFCGWVDHLTYRVIDDAGQPTELARFLAAWFTELAEYCAVADEHLLALLEAEAESENWPSILAEVRSDTRWSAPDLEDRLDRMTDDVLDALMRSHGIEGESDGNGWRNFSRWEIKDLVDVLRGMVARTARRKAVRQARRARKARRGWA